MLSKTALKALKELADEEQHKRYPRVFNEPAFPGACGHGGAILVKLGHAKRLGVWLYMGARRNRSFKFTRYALTESGIALAEQLELLKKV